MSTIALAVPQAPRLRITRRGRVVLGAILAMPIAVVMAVSALSGMSAEAGASSPSTSFDYITVAAGESLWDLAGWVAPDADPREVVASLIELNQLDSGDVRPGQRLAIPRVYAS